MPLDAWFVRLLPPPGSSVALDGLMIVASTLGLAAFVFGTPGWLWRRDRRLAHVAIGTMLVGLGVSLALQLLVLRPRPTLADPLLPLPPLPSFPSGHVVLVTIAVGVLIHARRGLGLALVPAALLVAISRVHVGHHHFTDVLGGLLLGVGLAAGALSRARMDPDDPWRLRWLLWPQLGLVLAISLVAYTGTFARGELAWLRLPGMDKVLHFLLFGLLALGAYFSTRGRAITLGRRPIPLAVLIPLLGAVAEELVQATSIHRTADPLDLLADLAGLVSFWWLGRALVARSSRVITSTPRSPKDP